MTSPTISAQCRVAQDILNRANDQLAVTLTLAQAIGLPPFRTAHITHALADNQHAWQELNELASSLELTGEPSQP